MGLGRGRRKWHGSPVEHTRTLYADTVVSSSQLGQGRQAAAVSSRGSPVRSAVPSPTSTEEALRSRKAGNRATYQGVCTF